MTQLREHVYQLMRTNIDPTVVPAILERGSFEATPQTRPFYVYVFGVEAAEPRWPRGPRRLVLRVYVHDDVGDYLAIDAELDRLETLFDAAPSAADGSGFIRAEFVERSEDFEDQELNTFYKFGRWQIVSNRTE